MPLYEYFCSECRSKFEVLTSYEASRGEMVCAQCHGTHVRKLMSVVARTGHSDGDDFGDYGDYGDSGDYGDGEDFGGGGGCSCGGGSCGCHN